MRDVTGTEVKAAMTAAGIASVDHHDCGLCGYMTKYVREGDRLYFDAGCNCTLGEHYEPLDWDDPADWINMQSKPEVKAQLAKSFGITDP